ncbi:MAG: arginine--tRNA ligase [Firmicutes bacterium]|nr:arginine--tRNA ligase [Bacillota bacterium]
MIDFKQQVAQELEKNTEGLTLEEIIGMIEIPPNSEMGDFAFPCFKLAKTMRKAPNLIAEGIAGSLAETDIFEKVENKGGYVNFFLDKKAVVKSTLEEVKEKGNSYGGSNVGEGKKVIVEYSSPNIAKPFHIGHIRSTVIGNSIYKIYDFLGYDTVRINHLGDYGTQFGKMIVAYRKWGNKEEVENEPIKTLLALYVKFHEEAEEHPELEDEAREVFKKLEDGEEEEVMLWKWFREESLKEFSRVYDMLGISFDSYAGESFYSDKMDRITDMMKEKDLLQKSDGAEIVDLSEYDMSPALIRKKDGSTLYITRDIAAAVYRKEHYNFDKNIYVVAAQQNLHFQQWFKIIELMGYDWADQCVHINFGLVSLDDGTMSTRKGKVVFLEDVLNRAVEKTAEIIKDKNVAKDNIDTIAKQVGIGAVVFQELSNNRIKDYTFSWDKVLNFEGETGPYVQYTHARACSVLRNATVELTNDVDYGFIIGDSAYELTKLILRFPQAVQDAADKYEPSVVARHIVDVAQAFNKFYHDEHIIVENEEEQKAKLLIVDAARQTLLNGLSLLGMEAPEKM